MNKIYKETLELARAAIEAGNQAEAKKLLRTALEERPEDPDGWLLMAYTADTKMAARLYLEKAAERGAQSRSLAEVQRWIDENFEDDSGGGSKSILTRRGPARTIRERLSPTGTALVYLILLGLAELLVSLGDPQWGMALHGMILVSLLIHSSLSSGRRERLFLFSLALTPLIRVMSLTIPLTAFPRIYWYAVIGAPLIIAAFFLMRTTGLTGNQVGINRRSPGLQIAIAILGIFLGLLEYLILQPEPLVTEFRLDLILVPALILLIFTGFLEELVFRGVLQYYSKQYLGRWGIVYVSIIFAAFHLGYNSALDFIFVFAVALIFGYLVQKTGSIVGVTLAHGLTNIFLYLVFPFILILPGSQVPVVANSQPEGVAEIISAAFQSISGNPQLTPSPISPSEGSYTLTPFMAVKSTATSQPTSTQPQTEEIINTDTPTPSMTPAATTHEADEFKDYSVLVDDGDPGFVFSGGNWWLIDQGEFGDLLWAYTITGPTSTIVEWLPNLAYCGLYRVEVYIPSDFGDSPGIAYHIEHADGISIVNIDQNIHQGEWVLLGEFWFDSEEPNKIWANNAVEAVNVNLIAAFDAIKWVLLELCSP